LVVTFPLSSVASTEKVLVPVVAWMVASKTLPASSRAGIPFTFAVPGSFRVPRTFSVPPPELLVSWFFSLKTDVSTESLIWFVILLPTAS
jgi:hypothetical protein